MEPGAGPPPADFVQSVGRAMLILEMVGRRPGLPVKAIARRCSLNISTTYHLIRTLAYEGYLVRLPDGTYVVGDAVARRFHDLVASLERPRRPRWSYTSSANVSASAPTSVCFGTNG
jgi:hypothetical protein